MVDGSRATVVSVLFPILATLTVAARLFVRVNILKNPGWEDVIIVVSLICSIIVSVFVCLQVKFGLGAHYNTLDHAQVVNVLKFLWASIPLYNLSLTLAKISLVLQYARIFAGKRFRLACWLIMGFIIASGIWAIFSAIFNCIPVHSFWDISYVGGHCMDKKFMWFFTASLNLLTDIILVAMPMPVLKSLQLPKKQKIGLMCIFGLGGFICLVSILRLHSLYIISISTDPTFDNTNAAIWSVIEINVSIICGSLATIRPIISRLFPNLLSTISLPTHNGTEVYEAYQAGGQYRHGRSPSNGSNNSNSPFQLTNVPRAHIDPRKMTMRDQDVLSGPPVPEKDERYSSERKPSAPVKDIGVKKAARPDVERRTSETNSEESFIIIFKG